jgi:hypothetical protein
MPELLNEIGKKTSVKYDGIKGELNKISNASKYKTPPQFILSQLLEQKVLSPGFQLKCPVCNKEHWINSDGLKPKVQCQKCLSEYTTPFHLPKSISHAYKAKGTFSLPDFGQGSFSVLLTMYFFAETMDYECTSAFSSELTHNTTKEKLEFDLGLLIQDSKMEYSEPKGVFVECKSHNSFLKKDVDKMKELGNQFPYSVLVFSSLKKKLEDKEKKLLQGLYKYYQNRAKKGQSHCFIMILTSNELFLHDRPPFGWEDLTAKHKKHAKNWNHRIRTVNDLCFSTNELYLK